jgi:hypothetical protein
MSLPHSFLSLGYPKRLEREGKGGQVRKESWLKDL